MIPLPNQSLAAAIATGDSNVITFTARCPCGQGDSTWTSRRTPGYSSIDRGRPTRCRRLSA